MSRLIANAFLLGMHDHARDTFQERAVEVHYQAGDHLFDVGDEADRFFLVCTGQVTERYTDGPGFTLHLGEGDVLGASCLVPPYFRFSTAIADVPVEALAFDRDIARKLSEVDHEFGYALYQRLFSIMVDRLVAASGHPLAD